jgi:hypothetical protein
MAIKRCKEPFAFEVDGMTRVVAAGSLVDTDDPAYSDTTAQHFEDVDLHVTEQQERRARASGAPVEQATAAPGEKRPAPSRRAARKAGDADGGKGG